MKPVKFEHMNCTFAENQPEYMPLPALRIEGSEGHVISCWKMSLKERVKVLLTGRVWLNLMCFNKPLTPSLLSVNRKDVYYHPDDSLPRWVRFRLFLKTVVKCFRHAGRR